MQNKDDYALRFNGIKQLFGEKANKLQNAKIAIVGLGGVGSWSAEALARSGVGHLHLYDLDDICTTNINRQIHALTSTIGKQKINVLADRIVDINPQCCVNAHHTWVMPTNVEELFSHKFDFIIDACDFVKTKVALTVFCKKNSIGFISCGSSGGKTDPTKIAIMDISKTIQDPLLARVRNILRKEYNYPKNGKKMYINVVSSCEAVRKEMVCDPGSKLDCGGGYGSAVFVTASFGFVATSFVINSILK